MLQDNGNITLFCAQNNHQRIIVNIPELTEHMFKSFKETYGITSETDFGPEAPIIFAGQRNRTAEDPSGASTKAEGEAAVNDASIQHGAHDKASS